jgi:DNA processing protein
MSADGERRARVALSFLAKPGDPVLGAALRRRTASELLALVPVPTLTARRYWLAKPRTSRCIGPCSAGGTASARSRTPYGWPPGRTGGLRIIVPGDAEWPTQLDDLGDTRPLLLWARGAADLRLSCVNSVAIVGARAATGYGQHVAIELAAALAERGTVTVSGGA